VKSPRFSGLLPEICLSLLLVTVLIASSAALPLSPPMETTVAIRTLEGAESSSSLDSPELQEVSLVVGRALSIQNKRDPVEVVLRNALTDEFGTSLSVAAPEVTYHVEWDPELKIFIWVCVNTTNFSVDFGPEGTVLVILSQRMNIS